MLRDLVSLLYAEDLYGEESYFRLWQVPAIEFQLELWGGMDQEQGRSEGCFRLVFMLRIFFLLL